MTKLGKNLLKGLNEALEHAKGKLRLRESRYETISLMLPGDVMDRIKKVAQTTNLSVSKVIEVLVTLEAFKAIENQEKPVKIKTPKKRKSKKKAKKSK